jgi:hypothetical protein
MLLRGVVLDFFFLCWSLKQDMKMAMVGKLAIATLMHSWSSVESNDEWSNSWTFAWAMLTLLASVVSLSSFDELEEGGKKQAREKHIFGELSAFSATWAEQTMSGHLSIPGKWKISIISLK